MEAVPPRINAMSVRLCPWAHLAAASHSTSWAGLEEGAPELCSPFRRCLLLLSRLLLIPRQPPSFVCMVLISPAITLSSRLGYCSDASYLLLPGLDILSIFHWRKLRFLLPLVRQLLLPWRFQLRLAIATLM
jgi:hypothetical protein